MNILLLDVLLNVLLAGIYVNSSFCESIDPVHGLALSLAQTY